MVRSLGNGRNRFYDRATFCTVACDEHSPHTNIMPTYGMAGKRNLFRACFQRGSSYVIKANNTSFSGETNRYIRTVCSVLLRHFDRYLGPYANFQHRKNYFEHREHDLPRLIVICVTSHGVYYVTTANINEYVLTGRTGTANYTFVREGRNQVQTAYGFDVGRLAFFGQE